MYCFSLVLHFMPICAEYVGICYSDWVNFLQPVSRTLSTRERLQFVLYYPTLIVEKISGPDDVAGFMLGRLLQ